MTVEELIEELKKYPKGMEVVVQYRDDGGDYEGYDTCLCFDTNDDKLIL